MATRADYRAALTDKLLGIEDSGYGDFDPSPVEMNVYLDLAAGRLYPAIYKRVMQSGLSVATYGTDSSRGSVTVAFPEKVYLVEDAVELTPVLGWSMRPTSLVGIDIYQGPARIITSVNVYYHDAFAMPADDVTDLGLSNSYYSLLVLGAFIECLESRHDTGVRPDVSKGYEQVSLIDRLTRRFESMMNEKAMGLPAVQI